MSDTATIPAAALAWIIGNDTGASSEAIFAHMAGLPKLHFSSPLDPADLGRCLRLLRAVPEWAPRIGEMAQYGPAWAGLVMAWKPLAALMAKECGIGPDFHAQEAPHTYTMMKVARGDR